MDDLDEQHDEDGATGDWTLQNIMEKLMQNGMIWVRRPQIHMHMMKDIERVMISSGWMNINQGISLIACGEELQQDDCYSRSNSEWKALLQTAKGECYCCKRQPGTE